MPSQAQRQKIRLPERLERKGPRKLLAIDGGGIRGVLSAADTRQDRSHAQENSIILIIVSRIISTVSQGPAPARSSPRESPAGNVRRCDFSEFLSE